MSEKIKTGIAVFLIIMILPYIITYALQGRQLFDIAATERMDKDTGSGQQDAQEPTETLTGILAGQISMELPEDVIRAQAVLVRTEYVTGILLNVVLDPLLMIVIHWGAAGAEQITR